MTMTIPASVAHDELISAITPLLDLLGVDPMSVLADPGICLTGDEVTLSVVGPFETSARAEEITVGVAAEWAVQAWRVTVKVDL